MGKLRLAGPSAGCRSRAFGQAIIGFHKAGFGLDQPIALLHLRQALTKAVTNVAMGDRQKGHLTAAARGRISLQFAHMLRLAE